MTGRSLVSRILSSRGPRVEWEGERGENCSTFLFASPFISAALPLASPDFSLTVPLTLEAASSARPRISMPWISLHARAPHPRSRSHRRREIDAGVQDEGKWVETYRRPRCRRLRRRRRCGRPSTCPRQPGSNGETLRRTFFAASLAVSRGLFWAAGDVVKRRAVGRAERRVEARAAPPAERRRNDMLESFELGSRRCGIDVEAPIPMERSC